MRRFIILVIFLLVGCNNLPVVYPETHYPEKLTGVWSEGSIKLASTDSLATFTYSDSTVIEGKLNYDNIQGSGVIKDSTTFGSKQVSFQLWYYDASIIGYALTSAREVKRGKIYKRR